MADVAIGSEQADSRRKHKKSSDTGHRGHRHIETSGL